MKNEDQLKYKLKRFGLQDIKRYQLKNILSREKYDGLRKTKVLPYVKLANVPPLSS